MPKLVTLPECTGFVRVQNNHETPHTHVEAVHLLFYKTSIV